MPEDRRLAAIMFTDIVGYTALMGSDEDKAFQLLEKNRNLHKPLIEKYNGTFVKESGDSILASFYSAYNAVLCARDIIEATQNISDLSLRIGIHEGDVVFKGNDVYGNGVNIASRIQEQANEGGICISESVYKNVKNKADINAEFTEEKILKNVDQPIKIYALTEKNQDLNIEEIIATPKSELARKSIIVLPFENISPDPDQEYFSDGLTEEIITDLSHIHDLMVISRNSAMTFKGTKKKTKEIASEVNVRYVLEGSVRKAGNNLRIVAQLIDAMSDTHLWAEKFSGTLDDVFDIQEKVSHSIVETLKLKLSPKEEQIIVDRSMDNVAVYELYLKAKDEIFKFTEEAIVRAIRNLNHGLEIIGDNAYLYSGLAIAYWNLVNIGIKQEEYLLKAEEYVNKALALDSEFQKAHAVNGWINHLGNPQKSAFHLKKALILNPDDSFSILGLLVIYTIHVGKISAAEPLLKKLLKIDPLDPFTVAAQGMFYYYNGIFDKALVTLRSYYQIAPENPYGQFWYILILCYHNKIEEAQAVVNRSILINQDNAITKLQLVLKHYLLNDKEGIFKIMTPDFIKTCQRDPTFSHHLAGVFALLDIKDEAMKWLECAVNSGLLNYPLFTKHDPWLENIRGEKRFKELIERVKKEWENFEV